MGLAGRVIKRLGRAWPFGRHPAAPRRDIATLRLEDALDQSGCPICTLGRATDRRGLWTLLYEAVNDPAVRREFRAALGFCPAHTRRQDEVARTERLGNVGQAILAEDLLLVIARRLEQAASRHRRLAAVLEARAPCPACVRREVIERIYLKEVCRWWDDAGFRERYRRSDGLCLPHLRALPEVPARRPLLEDGLARLRHLSASLLPRDDLDWATVEGRLWGWNRLALGRLSDPVDCPVCRIQIRAERQEFKQRLESGALPLVCPEHAVWLRAAAGGMVLLAASYRPAVNAAIEEIEERWRAAGGRRTWHSGWGFRLSKTASGASSPRCAICATGGEVARAACTRAIQLTAGDLVCLPHLRQSLRSPGAAAIAGAELPGLVALAASLREYIRKSDWNYRNEPRGAEQESWPHGRAFLAGPMRCGA